MFPTLENPRFVGLLLLKYLRNCNYNLGPPSIILSRKCRALRDWMSMPLKSLKRDIRPMCSGCSYENHFQCWKKILQFCMEKGLRFAYAKFGSFNS